MVNRRTLNPTIAVLALAAMVLTAAAWLRGAEYDEQYTLFLTGGTARPHWPDTPVLAGEIVAPQAGHAGLGAIAADLRRVDVHPPLYFWAVSMWRTLAGPGLFATRLFSVLCGLAALATVAAIARRCGIRPVPAMALTLGSYGFVYTSIIARGFALAQALTLCGVWLLTGPPTASARLAAGMLLGAASSCNYLSIFVGAAVGALARDWRLLAGAAPFLALDGWFFAVQRAARDGQFPPFSAPAALLRLISYQVAALFGGLPLYMDGTLRIAVAAGAGTLALTLAVAILTARPWAGGSHMRVLAVAAIAPAAGLLMLGVAFNNTPIELRYLCFGVPYIGLLAAWACGRRPAPWSRTLPYAVGAAQCAAIAGLAVAPATMQPALAAARAIARLGGDLDGGAIAVLPRGNDGVGIVGAFGIEAQAAQPVLIVPPDATEAEIASGARAFRRVILVLIAQDRDSSATLPVMRRAFTGAGWCKVAAGSTIEVYDRK